MIGFYNYTVILTFVGVISSLLGIASASLGFIGRAIIFLMVSGLCDMFDGRVARTRERNENEKKFGIQLDSLADIICFGVLPVVIGYAILIKKYISPLTTDWGEVKSLLVNPIPPVIKVAYIIISSLFVLAAIIRLAYFNVMEDERQQLEPSQPRKYYDGLPVTSVSLLLPIIYLLQKIEALQNYFHLIYMAALLIIAALFVIKIKVRKPGLRDMFIFIGIGFVASVVILML
ncbi:MAG: CDP-alcohol phosphatidyltransferase family protein [Clostridia bacterium]|nr:CDP-alcohol phosphatidyltransferase family protein [Clostridia bacterium]